MKRFTSRLLLALLAVCVGLVASASSSFYRRESASVTEGCAPATGGRKTYANEEYGYRLRYPEGWKLRGSGGAVYLCSPRVKSPCGPTPHEMYATVGVEIRDPEGLPLAEYLRAPARGYKDLRALRAGGVQAFATGPVDEHSGRFINEQVHLLKGGKVYTVIAYAVDACPKEFERVLASFEFTR